MRKAIAFLTVFVMSISLFAQTDVAKYGDKGAPEVRIPQTWHSNNSRTEDFTVVLTDSWGDGWDGAYMDVLVNGALVHDDITVDASTAEFTVAVDDGDIVQTVYTAGSYENEHSYAFYDQNGNYVAGDGPSPSAGIEFTASVSSDVPGCMTAAACNYSADATADDGSCCLTNCTTIAIGGGSYVSETSWSITDAAGNVIASGGGVESSEFSCLDDGEYTATGTDSWGDSWNGNILSVTDDDGTVYLSWEGPTSADGTNPVSVTFTVGAVTPPAPAVFFSEYIEGSSNNKAIEVYNGTSETISLDDYQIGQTSNGSDPGVWEYFHIFPAGATLEAGDVWVLLNSSVSSETYPDSANADEVLDYPSVVHHNGDDARGVLYITSNDTVVCDVIGETGPDPGTGWDVAGVTNATKDHTIVRKDAVMEGNGGDWTTSAGTNADDSEWIVFDQNDFSHLGWHIDAQCAANLVSVEMFDAWGDGWNGNWLHVGEDSVTIESGAYASAEFCLDDGSYTVSCGGGSYQSEVSWVMYDAAGDTLLAGGAPYDGFLQLGETNDVLGCTDADALNYDENATVDDGSCYFAGDSCSIAIQAVAGTNYSNGENQFFTYTTTMDGILTISSQNETGDATWDTFLAVYTDDCGTDVANNDDCCGYFGPSTVEIPMVAGTTYQLLWLDWYDPGPYPFTIVEGEAPTNPSNLTAVAGLESVSLEWDGYMPSNAAVANSGGARIEGAEANATRLAKMRDIKGDEPTEVHRFSVVHPDYVSNSRSTDVIIACDGGAWQSEVSWEIINEAGEIVVFGGAPSEVTASLDNGVYTVNGYDAWGDGWNGNVLTVTGATDGAPWLPGFTLEEGDFATTQFTMSDTPPELANLNMSDLHYDAQTDAVMITIHNTGGSTAYGFTIAYYRSNETSDVCENQDWDDFDTADYLEPDSSWTYPVLEDASYWMGYDTFSVGAFIDQMCTVSESDETDNTITTTLVIADPYDGVTWNVYRSDGGAEFASVGVAQSMDYLDEDLAGDVEYCYYVTQVDTVGATESAASNTACATPAGPVDLPVPTDLAAEADGWNVAVNWMAPDLTGFGTMSYTPSSGEKVDDIATYISYDPSDYPSPVRQGGDDLATAVAIDAFPYNNTGTTEGYTHDYDEVCPYSGSEAPDVVYSFTPTTATAVDVSLCGEGTGYDTKVYVYENEAGALASTVDGGEASACNDDECENSTTNWLSFLPGVLLNEGNTYYFVVDGYAGGSGAYEIDITEVDLPDPPSPVMGYNVYRGGELVGSTDHVDSTSYAEFVTVEGDHVYYATAMYDFYGESDPSNTDTVTVEAPAPLCNAPQNLEADGLGNDVSLSWDAPEGGAGWFGYNDGIIASAIGLNAAAEFSVAIRFGQEELADYNGMALTKVRFAHNEPTAFYQVAIWTAEAGGSPVLLDTTEWMDGAEIPAGEFYDVELDESITIDWSQELWIGYNINTPAGFPASCDGGPAVTGYGDLISTAGDFISMNAAYGLNYNWMIDGFADYADGRSIASMAPINVEYSAPATTNEPGEQRLTEPIVLNTPDERDMLNYILYRDGEAEDTLDIDENTYYDMDVEWGDHSYYVTALYNNSEECGESEPSNTANVSLYNNPPPPVMLLQPDDGAMIAIDESNMGTDFPFIWTAVNDEDNDPVTYVVSATDEAGEVRDTSLAMAGWFPTFGHLAEPLLEDSVSVMTYSWNVFATDSWDSSASLNGPRTLTIDVSGLLALDGIGLPEVFALHNNYPNPFNPVTNITYDIPEVAQVTLDIYNVSGQKVRTLAQGQHEPGRYRIQWNATNDYGNPLSSGMYIYRIHAGDFVSVKKLILMK